MDSLRGVAETRMLLRRIFAKTPGKELVFNFYYVQRMRISMSKSGAFLAKMEPFRSNFSGPLNPPTRVNRERFTLIRHYPCLCEIGEVLYEHHPQASLHKRGSQSFTEGARPSE